MTKMGCSVVVTTRPLLANNPTFSRFPHHHPPPPPRNKKHHIMATMQGLTDEFQVLQKGARPHGSVGG